MAKKGRYPKPDGSGLRRSANVLGRFFPSVWHDHEIELSSAYFQPRKQRI